MQDDEHGHQVGTQSMKREVTRTKLFPVESVGFDKSHTLWCNRMQRIFKKGSLECDECNPSGFSRYYGCI